MSNERKVEIEFWDTAGGGKRRIEALVDMDRDVQELKVPPEEAPSSRSAIGSLRTGGQADRLVMMARAETAEKVLLIIGPEMAEAARQFESRGSGD